MDTLIYRDDNDLYQNNLDYSFTECLPIEHCYRIILLDEYGDGFQDLGYVRVLLNDEVLLEETNFGGIKSTTFNCPIGLFCENPIESKLDRHTQNEYEQWYLFTAEDSGRYELSTCNSSIDCNTTIWLYEYCLSEIGEGNEGTLLYNSQNNECNQLAQINAVLEEKTDYNIRVRKEGELCDFIQFDIVYQGIIPGCMDTDACNYNPFATENDGSCFDWEDPRCINGPDLTIDAYTLGSTIRLDSMINMDDCLIEENCITGYGFRYLMRFSTRLENIGNLDYFVGNATTHPDQFEYDPCHRHNHIVGYAKYDLYTTDGNIIPIGYKNGFCLMDTECPSVDMYKYDCLTQGISAGCYDVYDSSLPCQWLDITDIPSGEYILLARVNPDFKKDAFGRSEKDSLNNTAQVCLTIDRVLTTPTITVKWECEAYIDCAGQLYGNATIDCNGECNGLYVSGDLNYDQTTDEKDVQLYVDQILNSEYPTTCSDLYPDQEINIYDAALLKSCILYGEIHEHTGGADTHSHCTFPTGIYNQMDTVEIKFIQPSLEKYIDIQIKNPLQGIFAFQFEFIGSEISSISELNSVPEQLYDLRYNDQNGMITGIAASNNGLSRSNEFQDLLRIHFDRLDGEICMLEDFIIVSDRDEIVAHKVKENCIELTVNSNEINGPTPTITIFPNPTTSELTIKIGNSHFSNYKLYTIKGELLEENPINQSGLFKIQKSLNAGVYFLYFQNEDQIVTEKFVVQ